MNRWPLEIGTRSEDASSGDSRMRRSYSAAKDAGTTSQLETHNESGKPFKWTRSAVEILEKMRRFGLRTMDAHRILKGTKDPGD